MGGRRRHPGADGPGALTRLAWAATGAWWRGRSTCKVAGQRPTPPSRRGCTSTARSIL